MEGTDSSSFSPIALVSLLVLGYLVWSLPRRYAVSPLLVMVGLMPMGQQLEVAGLHFYLFRILLVIGMVRVKLRGELARFVWTRNDKIFAWWVLVSVVFGTLVKPSTELLVSRLGDAFNAVGCYFFVRCVIVDFDDIVACVRTLAYVSVPVAILMFVERATMHNPLSIFSGVPEVSAIRDGHVRSQGAFRHAILAGTFGATQFPLFIALWFEKSRRRWLATAGIIASLVIVGTAGSSGALMAVAGAILGIGLWQWRTKMRLVRRVTLGLILAMALVMNAPVWYLFARVSDLVGGGGWHRAYVIDTAIRHFNEWWLFGTTYTAHWGPGGEVIAANPDMMDITNQFVIEGVNGGILKLALFVAIIVGCFKIVGRRVHEEEGDRFRGFMFWTMGVSLFAHCLSFMSVPYFDQMIIIWYWLLASVSSAALMQAAEPSEVKNPEDASGAWKNETDAASEVAAS
jgi:multisubunit Na+/H+ antiporter MnhG subunit